MAGLALFRVVLGALSWFLPTRTTAAFGVSREDPQLEYLTRVFGVRAIALGAFYLGSDGAGRRRTAWLWLMCDAADTVAGTSLAARGSLPARQAASALLVTSVSAVMDAAYLRQTSDG